MIYFFHQDGFYLKKEEMIDHFHKGGMTMTNGYLTKSRFKLALECPTKLYYIGKKYYANEKLTTNFYSPC